MLGDLFVRLAVGAVVFYLACWCIVHLVGAFIEAVTWGH